IGKAEMAGPARRITRTRVLRPCAASDRDGCTAARLRVRPARQATTQACPPMLPWTSVPFRISAEELEHPISVRALRQENAARLELTTSKGGLRMPRPSLRPKLVGTVLAALAAALAGASGASPMVGSSGAPTV